MDTKKMLQRALGLCERYDDLCGEYKGLLESMEKTDSEIVVCNLALNFNESQENDLLKKTVDMGILGDLSPAHDDKKEEMRKILNHRALICPSFAREIMDKKRKQRTLRTVQDEKNKIREELGEILDKIGIKDTATVVKKESKPINLIT